MTVVYKYNLGDFVYDQFGSRVLIMFLGVDDGGIQYNVRYENGNANWINEKDLKHD